MPIQISGNPEDHNNLCSISPALKLRRAKPVNQLTRQPTSQQTNPAISNQQI
jgi:hypothetical protein